jgi:hypothetical protein
MLIMKEMFLLRPELSFIKVKKYIQLVFLTKYTAVRVMTSELYWQQSLIEVSAQSTTQYKIKLMLQNETALSASLEHNKVLNHSLLDFFSAAMVVQIIATKGTDSV